MANPNIVDVATINAGNIGFNLGISSGSIKLMAPAADKVIKINTFIMRGKLKSFKGKTGYKKDYKKAIVTLAEGNTIDSSLEIK